MSISVKTICKQAIAPFPASWRTALRQKYRSARDVIHAWRYALHDAAWYIQYSGLKNGNQKGVLQARILKAYHRIEKGLALSSPRPGFGPDAVEMLIDDLAIYQRHFGRDHILERALQTLDEYRAFNEKAGIGSIAVTQALTLHDYVVRKNVIKEGGTIEITRNAIHAASQKDLTAFFKSRYSIRQFSHEPVNDVLIEEAVRMAQKTPSVCNRESGRLFVVSDPAKIQMLLNFQNGNRGFGEQANKLLVITARLDCFLTPEERYQAWIDGGLFAMSLIYALHSQGLGSCCLNWSVAPDTDVAFKKASGIPTDHAVIMLLAVGHLPEKLRVAISARRPIEDVLLHI